MADTFKMERDEETFKVESDPESTSGDSDYCPSNASSYRESSPRSKPPSRSRKRTAEEAESRTLMRQWLRDLIDGRQIPGLSWIDDNKTLVHIPWLHASRHTFDTDKDSTLFKLWAIHSGKYVPSEDQPDPKRWKANFRCAINSLSDVHEVKDQSCKKGHAAYKVYRFDPDRRLAKKLSCSANERTISNDVPPPSEKKVCKRAVLNADRRALIKARKMNKMNRSNETATTMPRACEPAIATARVHESACAATQASDPATVIIEWLKQQKCSHYGNTCNDTSFHEFSGMRSKNEVSPVVKYEGPGFYRPTAAGGRGDTSVTGEVHEYPYAKDVATRNMNVAAVPPMVDEYSSRIAITQHTTYEASVSPYSPDMCGSPTGTDTSIDSALTDDSITEMIDEWQSEPKSETDSQWFMQLTSVNVTYTPENNYNYHNFPAQVGLTHLH